MMKRLEPKLSHRTKTLFSHRDNREDGTYLNCRSVDTLMPVPERGRDRNTGSIVFNSHTNVIVMLGYSNPYHGCGGLRDGVVNDVLEHHGQQVGVTIHFDGMIRKH